MLWSPAKLEGPFLASPTKARILLCLASL
jgi:hypothetical protein